MTEEKARQKWCPMSRLVSTIDGNVVDNRTIAHGGGLTNAQSCFCIASDCACWVEEEWHKEDIGGGHFENSPAGHCGLIR